MSDDPVVSAQTRQMWTALGHQVQALEALAGRFEQVLGGIPHAVGSEIWRGDAHRLYVAAVEALARELAAADALIRSALSNSRRALSTMADRVG